jgi:hypothetical protein
MRRLLLLLTLAVAPTASFLPAQSPAPQPPATACPSTVTLDRLIAAVDTVVSGPANQDRTCFRQIFTPDARLIPIRIAADGIATPRILTVQDWIDAVAKRGALVFYERQIKVRTETWGHIAHMWSTYETRTTPDGKALDRGINSIQAVYDGKQWHVQEILWQAETPIDPIPEKYLP